MTYLLAAGGRRHKPIAKLPASTTRYTGHYKDCIESSKSANSLHLQPCPQRAEDQMLHLGQLLRSHDPLFLEISGCIILKLDNINDQKGNFRARSVRLNYVKFQMSEYYVVTG